jgi:hypothetical protein
LKSSFTESRGEAPTIRPKFIGLCLKINYQMALGAPAKGLVPALESAWDPVTQNPVARSVATINFCPIYFGVFKSSSFFNQGESTMPAQPLAPRAWHKINKMPHPACPVRPPGPKDLKNSDFLIDFK